MSSFYYDNNKTKDKQEFMHLDTVSCVKHKTLI